MLEDDLLRRVAFDAERARALEDGAAADHLDAAPERHPGQPARELGDDAVVLPGAERLDRYFRLAVLDADLPRALHLVHHVGDVQQRLRRDAPLEEAGAAQALARVHHDGVEASSAARKAAE